MKTLRAGLAAALLAALVSAGCLMSGQITFSYDLDSPIDASSATTIYAQQVDLNQEEDYADNKDKLEALVDVAFLGTFTNTGAAVVDVVVYMTPAQTSHTTDAALAADITKKLVWGPFKLNPGESKKIGWDESAKLFDKAGFNAISAEVLGDGSFTLYAAGKVAPYSVRVTKGVAVMTIDVKK